MGCQSTVDLGDNLTFSICTHDPDTGELTDADSAPAYRVYENETTTPILTGTMAKLDDANTTGFYTELIACTAANGFEDGKSYTVYITATVDGATGGIAYGFRVESSAQLLDDVWAYSTRTLTQSAASVAAAVSGSDITITRGDTLSASITGLGALTGYVSVDFSVKNALTDVDDRAIMRVRVNASGTGDGLIRLNGAAATAGNGSITIDDEAAGNITIAVAAAATAKLMIRSGLTYDVQLITASAVSTLTQGTCKVSGDVTRLIA